MSWLLVVLLAAALMVALKGRQVSVGGPPATESIARAYDPAPRFEIPLLDILVRARRRGPYFNPMKRVRYRPTPDNRARVTPAAHPHA